MVRDGDLEKDDCPPEYDGASTSSKGSNQGRAVKRLLEIMEPKTYRSPLFSKSDKTVAKPRRSVVERALNNKQVLCYTNSSTPFKPNSKEQYFFNTSPLENGSNLKNTLDTEIVKLPTNKETSCELKLHRTGQNLDGINKEISESIIKSNKENSVSIIRMAVPSLCGESIESSIVDNGNQSERINTRFTENSVQLDEKNCTNVNKRAVASFNKSSTVKTYKNKSKIHSDTINVHDPSGDLNHCNEARTNTSNINSNVINNVHDPSGNINHCNEASPNTSKINSKVIKNVHDPSKNLDHFSEANTSSENESSGETAEYSSRKSRTSKTIYKRLHRLEKEVQVLKTKTISEELTDKAITTENEKLRNLCTRKTCTNAVTRCPEIKYVSHRRSNLKRKFQNKTWTCNRSASPALSPCRSSKNVCLEKVSEKSLPKHSKNFEVSKQTINLHTIVDKLSLKKHNELGCTTEQLLKECKEVQTSNHLNTNSNNILQNSYESVLFKTIPDESRTKNNFFATMNAVEISPATSGNNLPWRFSQHPSISQDVSSINPNIFQKCSEGLVTNASRTNKKSYMREKIPTVSTSSESSSTTKNTAGSKLSSYELQYSESEAEESATSFVPKETSKPPLPTRAIEVKLKKLFVTLERLPIKQSSHLQSSAAKHARRDRRSSLKENASRTTQNLDSSKGEVAEQIVFKVPKISERKLKRKTSVKSIIQVDIDSPLREDLPEAEHVFDGTQDNTELKDCPEPNRKTKPKRSSAQKSKKQSKRELSLTKDVSVAEHNSEGLRRSSRIRKPPLNPLGYCGIFMLPRSMSSKKILKNSIVPINANTSNADENNDSNKSEQTASKVRKTLNHNNNKKSITVLKTRKSKRIESRSDESQKPLNEESFPVENSDSKKFEQTASKVRKTLNKINNKKSTTALKARKNKILQSNADESQKPSNDYEESLPGPSNIREESTLQFQPADTAEYSAKDLNSSNVSQVFDCEDGSFREDDAMKKQTIQKFKKLREDLSVGKVILGPGVRTKILKKNMEVVYFISEGCAIFNLKGKNRYVYAKSALPFVRVPAGVAHVITNKNGVQPVVIAETKLGPDIDSAE